MPASKKRQSIKDQTYRRREVRKHRKACRKALGPLGMYLFREFLNLHGRLPIETTARWAEAAAQVFGDEGSAMRVRESGTGSPADYRGQFGGWTQALLRRSLDLPRASGLCFALRVIEVQGTSPSSWHSLVLILYERQCGVLFHQVMRLGDRDPHRGDTVWRAVDQAILRLSGGRWPLIQRETLKSEPVTVAFPVDARGQWTHPIFAEAARLPRSQVAPQCKGITWAVTTFRGLRNVRCSADPYTFLELEKMLRQEAGSVSSALKALMSRARPRSARKTEGRERPLRPAWSLLFAKDRPYEYGRDD